MASTEQAAALAAAGVQLPQFCPGCGIKLQLQDTKAPGYFLIPEKLLVAKGIGLGPRGRARAAMVMDEADDDDDLEYAAAKAGKLPAGLELRGQEEERQDADDGLPDVVCQRCYSLRHAG